MNEREQVLHVKDTLCNGRYKICRFINRGKYAQVYEAVDLRMADTQGGDARVAVKILNPEHWDDAEAKQRLAREGRLQKNEALGRHRNVVTVLEMGEHVCVLANGQRADRVPFLVMEYVEHITLEDYLAQHHRLTASDPVLAIVVKQLGNALEWIHRAEGVVHRDLAAHNVLLRCVRNNGSVRLLDTQDDFVQLSDFGLAFTQNEGTITQDRGERIAANLRYASPEILYGETPTPQDDVHAFGVLIFRMLTGEFPFPMGDLKTQEDRWEYAQLVKSRPVMFPDPDAVPEPVQDCVIKAMAKTRQERYANAQEMTTALLAVLPSPAAKPKPHMPTKQGKKQATSPQPVSSQAPAATTMGAVKPAARPQKRRSKLRGCFTWTLGMAFLIAAVLIILIVGAIDKWVSTRDKPDASPTAQLELVTPSGYEVASVTPQPTRDAVIFTPDDGVLSAATVQPTQVPSTPQPTSAAPGLAQAEKLAFAYVSYADGVTDITGRPYADDADAFALFRGPDDAQHLAWSPGEDLLAYVSAVEGAPAVYVSDGINARRLSPPETVERWPTWRPDGSALVVSTEAEGRAYLSLVELASGRHSPLTGPHFNAWSPAWSPADDYLAFVSDMGEGEDVYVLSLSDLDRALVNVSRSGDVYADAPAWAPDGKWLVYATENGLRWVSIENLEPGTPHAFTQNGQDRAPCFLNEREILFQRTSGAGTLSIFQARLGAEAQQRLIDNAAWPACRP